MANEGRGDADAKRTVILDQQAHDKATRILSPDIAGGAPPGGSGHLPPTQIIGGGAPSHGGSAYGNPPNATSRPGSPATMATRPVGGDYGGSYQNPNLATARPGHAATRVLMPSMDVPGATGAPHQSATAHAASASETPEPVVGWLVVISGPGRGGFRPVYYGNNAMGRDPSQRIPLNFGDTAISGEEQAFIRYDFETRKFALIPNLSKPNIVMLNSDKPMVPVELKPFDEISIGATRLRFVPLCGPDFEWSDPGNQ